MLDHQPKQQYLKWGRRGGNWGDLYWCLATPSAVGEGCVKVCPGAVFHYEVATGCGMQCAANTEKD